ncbi:hypothetical protein [Rhodalgimonas zhirmunskyi]|uniref:Uncharacterized protein n=1 Tax=Rhodalgimonas zhirmunskyi TaxID=2964767 RepID=A0AAJ1U3N1_9RHOB|nr:hypothetical protein [Rhodoalgimonas zhirmunskyi]MDQ2092630.1 hypothetical protein [Rhodoalgimonas zhirmunskyi]
MTRILCLTFAAVLTLPTPLWAEKPLAQYFGADNNCYGQAYTEADLAARPDQAVTAIRLTHFPRSEGFFDAQGRKVFYPDTPEIVVNLTIRHKGHEGPLLATGFCWPDGTGMACGLECDAGQFSLTGTDKDTLLLTLTSKLQFDGCGGTSTTLTTGDAKHGFEMRRLSADTCAPLD